MNKPEAEAHGGLANAYEVQTVSGSRWPSVIFWSNRGHIQNLRHVCPVYVWGGKNNIGTILAQLKKFPICVCFQLKQELDQNVYPMWCILLIIMFM